MCSDKKDSFLKNKEQSKYKEYLKGVVIAIIGYVVIIFLIIITYDISRFFKIIVPTENLEYINSTSSILMAAATIVYVAFTYSILNATNKNTEQTAKAQKIAYLERRLEKFYLPMYSLLLKNHPKLLEGDTKIYLVQTMMPDNKRDVPFFIDELRDEFQKEYFMLRQYSYLSLKKSSNILEECAEAILNAQRDVIEFSGKYLHEKYMYDSDSLVVSEESVSEYNRAKSLIEIDISSLKSELSELVNL